MAFILTLVKWTFAYILHLRVSISSSEAKSPRQKTGRTLCPNNLKRSKRRYDVDNPLGLFLVKDRPVYIHKG